MHLSAKKDTSYCKSVWFWTSKAPFSVNIWLLLEWTAFLVFLLLVTLFSLRHNLSFPSFLSPHSSAGASSRWWVWYSLRSVEPRSVIIRGGPTTYWFGNVQLLLYWPLVVQSLHTNKLFVIYLDGIGSVPIFSGEYSNCMSYMCLYTVEYVDNVGRITTNQPHGVYYNTMIVCVPSPITNLFPVAAVWFTSVYSEWGMWWWYMFILLLLLHILILPNLVTNCQN